MSQPPFNEAMRTELRHTLGLDLLSEPGPPTAGVVMIWPEPTAAPGLAGFAPACHDVTPQPGGAEGEWILRRGPQTLLLRVFVARDDNAVARERLLDIGANTSMQTSPFHPTRPRIGSLSIGAPRPAGRLIWVYYNCCVDLRIMNGSLDLMPSADWLQRRMSTHLVRDAAPSRSWPAAIAMAPQVPAVGERVSVVVTPATGRRPGDSVLAIDHDPDALDLVDEADDRAVFEVLRTGSTRISVTIVDRATLLSRRVPLELKPTP